MKRIGGLFDRITTLPNWLEAFYRASQGRTGARIAAVRGADLDASLERLAKKMAAGEFAFGPYVSFWVRDPKLRLIRAPPFWQRVAHHAIVSVAGPVLELGATDRSHACRRGRGQAAALRAARRYARRGGWYLKMDVRQFYDSVRHDVLLSLLARRFRERRLLRLFAGLLASHETAPGCGLPIGALTSQYLANFLLDGLDRLLLAFPGLAGRGLELKHGGEINRCEQGIPFLGFVIYPRRMRLNRQGRIRLRRRLRRYERDDSRGALAPADFQQRATALFAWAAAGDDLNWRRAVCSLSRFERDAQGRQPRAARGGLEQRSGELPGVVPEQEEAG